MKYIPEWFPGAKFKRQAKVWKAVIDDMLHVPFNAVKEQMARGEECQCATTSLLEGVNKEASNCAYIEDVIQAAVGTIYGGKWKSELSGSRV